MLTGFRGNGKSTELRRLKKRLEDQGCVVLLIDMLEYVIITKPLDISDFILSLVTGFAEITNQELGLSGLHETYWERIKQFLSSTTVGMDGVNVGVEAGMTSAELGLKLKTDPSFKQTLQQRLRGHLTMLVKEARDYVVAVVTELRRKEKDPDLKVVLLVDSMEQLRGVGADAEKVHQSVVDTFSGHSQNLTFPLLHVVYTVPPYLVTLAPNYAQKLGGNPIVSWPNIHVRNKDGGEDGAGIAVMREIVARRFPKWQDFVEAGHLEQMATTSGGDIRDFFRLVRECLVIIGSTHQANTSDEMVRQVTRQLKNDMLPIADADATWLLQIHETKNPALKDTDDLPRLARFFDHNLIMNYQNGGEPWYDVHPIVVEELKRDRRPNPPRKS